MTPFLRRVMERRLEEQMQAVPYEVRPILTCRRCRKEYQAKKNSHPEFCFNCRHTIRRGYGCPDTSRVGIQDTP